MSRTFAEVHPDDFSRITLERLPHQEIEMTLIAIGGGGVRGTQFKTEVVQAAGWQGERLATYAGKPEMAADTFNRIRAVLGETDDGDEIMARLKSVA